MATMTVSLRSLPDSAAAIGRAGVHSIVVDRPAGKAGGQGLGFNGGQLLALAIGGCLCNDLHYVAHEMGITLTSIAVEVAVEFEGQPLLATRADVKVSASAADPKADIATLIDRARADSTVSNSIMRGVKVDVARA